MDLLTHKLRRLKGSVKEWERTKNLERRQQILDINIGISDLLLDDSGILSVPNKIKWESLQEKKSKYWAHEITTQRLKSRVLWFKEGDENTIFVHSFASTRRNSNAIWSMNDMFGNVVSEDAPLKQLGKQHFSDLFQDDGSTNISDQLKAIRIFPTLTEKEDVDQFLEPITTQEVEVVLKGFKKDKSPGPDGWLVELFLSFF